jgi:hypothetical protein
MHHARMMKDRFSRAEVDGHGLKLISLLGRKHVQDGLHVVKVPRRDGQQVPLVRSANILNTSVVNGLLIQGNVHGDVLHGLCSRPIRVVLQKGREGDEKSAYHPEETIASRPRRRT